jgi:very-short-patch-repair endonuclease
MSGQGLQAVAAAHYAGSLVGAQVELAAERAILTAWTIAARDADPILRDFDGKNHHRLVDRFRVADGKHIDLARKHVAAVVTARLPTAGAAAPGSTSEPGILRRELAKKTRHMPLRKLLQQIPNLLVRLKPCLLTSPLSVAQYLPAKGRRFDIVVFDEASQICTHDAIGAIGRGSQLVVVGDSKQLPPSSFFQSGASDDVTDEDDFPDLESILDESVAAGLPQQMLGWHYRSRHESLIQFSNEHYYDGRLNVFPAARGRVDDLGVKFHHVPNGVYDAGKSRTNPIEARALVAVLVDELFRVSPGERSFGVVTFSMSQQELVEELLSEVRRTRPEIEQHFADDHPNHEQVFVKNLENVQGDERDEILFSVGYGPDAEGAKRMNFGPLNRSGGERRLNVGVTRARKQLRLFSSITHDWIDTSRTQARGAAHLKAFLRFAAEESQPAMARTGEQPGDFDSDFERDVFDMLRAAGHRVETQVGCGAYRIDLAVVHPNDPGIYVLGIECDGAAYHSGATARDRDRLRQTVLEDLGWRLHRIWSTDWGYDRANEMDRLLAAVDGAVREGLTVLRPVPVQANPRESTPAPNKATEAAIVTGPIVPYLRARVAQVSTDPDEIYRAASRATLRAVVEQVAAEEAPIHFDELSRRVASAFGVPRLTPRLRRLIQEIVAELGAITMVEQILWTRAVTPGDLAQARAPSPGNEARDADMLPAQEIAVAARWILAGALSMPMSELLRATARVFGIQRVGAKVEERMTLGIQVLVARGLCTEENGRAVWNGAAA